MTRVFPPATRAPRRRPALTPGDSSGDPACRRGPGFPEEGTPTGPRAGTHAFLSRGSRGSVCCAGSGSGFKSLSGATVTRFCSVPPHQPDGTPVRDGLGTGVRAAVGVLGRVEAVPARSPLCGLGPALGAGELRVTVAVRAGGVGSTSAPRAFSRMEGHCVRGRRLTAQTPSTDAPPQPPGTRSRMPAPQGQQAGRGRGVTPLVELSRVACGRLGVPTTGLETETGAALTAVEPRSICDIETALKRVSRSAWTPAAPEPRASCFSSSESARAFRIRRFRFQQPSRREPARSESLKSHREEAKRGHSLRTGPEGETLDTKAPEGDTPAAWCFLLALTSFPGGNRRRS